MNLRAMLLAALHRAALDALQILHHNLTCIHGFSKGHQSLRGDVEEVPCYGSLSIPQPLQKAAGRAGANTSNSSFNLADTCPVMVECTSSDIQCFVRFWLNGHKEILNSRIYANYCSSSFKLWDIDLNGQDNIPLLTNEFEFGVTPSAAGNWATFEISLYSPNRQTILGKVEITFPADGRSDFLKNSQSPSPCRFGGSIKTNNVSEQRTGNLTRELEFCSDCSIEFVGESCWCCEFWASTEYNFGEPVGGLAISETNLWQLGVFCS